MDHITLAGGDTPERARLAEIVARLSPESEANYQLRKIYGGPWVVAGEGEWPQVGPGEVYLSALWMAVPSAAWIGRDGSVRWGRGADPSRPSLAAMRAIIEAYVSGLRRAA